MRACSSRSLSWRTDGGRSLALALDDLDLRAQVEDPLLEHVLLACSSLAVSTSGVRSWVVYRTRGPSEASWAAIRNPSASRATPSVTCQVGMARSRRTRDHGAASDARRRRAASATADHAAR